MQLKFEEILQMSETLALYKQNEIENNTAL